MRYFSVIGDIDNNEDVTLVLLALTEKLTPFIDRFQDTEKIVFMYIPEEKITSFSMNLFSDSNLVKQGSVIFFENMKSRICTMIDLSSSDLDGYEALFMYLQGIKKAETSAINPLKQKNTVREIIKWLENQGYKYSTTKCALHETEDKKVSYALSDNERELLAALLAKSDFSDLKILLENEKSRRIQLMERYFEIGEIDKAEALQQEIDNIAIMKNNEYAQQQKISIEDIWSRYPYLNLFEDKSKRLIRSCMISEKAMEGKVEDDFDYTLWASGYWRAIELELNIIIVDSLRYYRNVIHSLPSNHISQVNGPVNEKTGSFFNYVTHSMEDMFENINKTRGGRLKEVMFAGLTGLSKCYEQNNVHRIYQKIDEIDMDIDLFSVLPSYLTSLDDPIYKLRNACSHPNAMSLEEFEVLKSTLFDDNHGVFFVLSEMKKAINNNEFHHIKEI